MNLFNWNEIEIFTFFLVLVRVTSFIAFLPIFGDKVISPIIKILFGLSFSFIVFPVAWSTGTRVKPEVFNSMNSLVATIGGEVLFGVLVGFVAKWVFEAIQVAGYFMATAMGFSMGTVFNPSSEAQSSAVSEIQYALAALLFLSMDGHHIYLKAIIDSFQFVPLAGSKVLLMNESIAKYLIEMTAEVLLLGLKLSAPILAILFIVNLTFGVISKAVPQINILVVSFAINILVGLFVLFISMPGFMNMVGSAFENYTPEILKFIKLFGA